MFDDKLIELFDDCIGIKNMTEKDNHLDDNELFFKNIIVPLIDKEISIGNKDVVKKIFDKIEILVKDKYEEIESILFYTVFNYVLENEEELIDLFLDNTRKLYLEQKANQIEITKKCSYKTEDINLMMLSAFPELEKRFNEETEWLAGIFTDNCHVFNEVLLKYLYENIENETIVKKVIDFFNDLLSIDDKNILVTIDYTLMLSIIKNGNICLLNNYPKLVKEYDRFKELYNQ